MGGTTITTIPSPVTTTTNTTNTKSMTTVTYDTIAATAVTTASSSYNNLASPSDHPVEIHYQPPKYEEKKRLIVLCIGKANPDSSEKVSLHQVCTFIHREGHITRTFYV